MFSDPYFSLTDLFLNQSIDQNFIFFFVKCTIKFSAFQLFTYLCGGFYSLFFRTTLKLSQRIWISLEQMMNHSKFFSGLLFPVHVLIEPCYINPAHVNLYCTVYNQAPSTRIRFQTKTELFCSGYGYRPHCNAENDHRKRSHSKTLSRVERFENDAF